MELSKENINHQNTNKVNQYRLNQYKQSEERLKDSVFIDRNEELQVVLGDSYLKNYFQTGRLERSFAVLTDRRVYMKGRCYEKKGLFGLRRTNIDKVIDVQDVTGTEYRHVSYIWIKILKWMLLGIVGSICLFFGISLIADKDFIEALITIASTGGLIYLILQIDADYEFLDISFAGGQIAYDCNIATTVEVEEFQRQMRLAKDKKVSKQETAPGHPKIIENSDKIKKLKELKELLDSRVITEQEFEKLKSEVMNCN